MTDDVMKKVESLLFDEDEVPEKEAEEQKTEKPKKIIKEPEEDEEEREEKHKEETKPKKELKPIRKETSMNYVEIFFDGRIEISGTRIKVVPGSEIETGNLKFVFEDNSAKIYEI